MTNYYAVLGIRPDARLDEIRSAYRAAARKAHPDAQGDAEAFHALQAAYDVLRDSTKRAQYDEARRAWMKTEGAVACPICGHANRLTRRPSEREVVRCWHCKTQLVLASADFASAQRQSLLTESARVVDEIGADLADLAADAVRAGIARLRLRMGLGVKARLKP